MANIQMQLKRRTTTLALVFLAIASPPVTAQETRVSAGDSVVVLVRDRPDLGGRLQVNVDGGLVLPGGAIIPVSGLLPSIIAARVREAYRPTYGQVRVTVTRLPYDGRRLLEEAQPSPATLPREVGQARGAQPSAVDESQVIDVAPGDVLDVRIRGYPDLGGRLQVGGDGSLALPGGGRIAVAGYSPSLVAGRIAAAYAPEYGRVRVAVSRVALGEDLELEDPAQAAIQYDAAEGYPPFAPTPWRFGLAAVGGVASAGSPDHLFGGLVASLGRGRLGVMGFGEYGSGGGYASVLLSGGVTYELLRVGGLSLSGTGGYGYYSENGDSGIERSIPAAMAGGIATVDVGRFKPAVVVTGHFGSYDGADVSEAITANFLRVSIGIGF